MTQHRPGLIGMAAAAAVLVGAAAAEARATEFQVTFTPGVRNGPVTARVYVMLRRESAGAEPGRDPRFGPDWFRPQPFFAVDARGWRPGEALALAGDGVAGFPGPLASLEPGGYAAQAVLRLNPDTHKLGDGEGNAYGPVVRFTVGDADKGGGVGKTGPVGLTVDAVVPRRVFRESERVRYVELDSPLLSAFYKRPIKHRAGVVLPEVENVDEVDPDDRRGTLYIIPGFGGDHFAAERMGQPPRAGGRSAFGTNLIRVVLDPDCGTGHHVFADSATNGPRGRALVEELIPHIEKTFPARRDPKARLLNGHSSGGWSSLWLQVNYPDVFGGTWSTSPDPVDFHDFQQVDLYAPGVNLFVDPAGNRRPIARRGTRAVLFYDAFSKMEDVIGDGGQLHSFEAVFSPLDPDGRPRRLWERATGAVDPDVARSWEPYDIRRKLEREWPTIGPKLTGKLHVVVGSLDTFYLEGAVARLKASLGALGSDAEVEIVPGRDHSTVIDSALAGRFDREMEAAAGPASKTKAGD